MMSFAKLINLTITLPILVSQKVRGKKVISCFLDRHTKKYLTIVCLILLYLLKLKAFLQFYKTLIKKLQKFLMYILIKKEKKLYLIFIFCYLQIKASK